jgi:hypothetical protein
VAIESKELSGALANLSASAIAIYNAVKLACDPDQLDAAARLLWEGYNVRTICDEDAEFLSSCIQRRRPVARHASPALAKPIGALGGRIGSRFVSRQRPRSPDRKASRDRRRMLGGSSTLPSNLRHPYTEGMRAVLTIVAGEVKKRGICDLKYKVIAALAGCCETLVQNTMHEARRLGHVRVTERPQPGQKNLSNLIEIVSPEWRAWMKIGRPPRA